MESSIDSSINNLIEEVIEEARLSSIDSLILRKAGNNCASQLYNTTTNPTMPKTIKTLALQCTILNV